MEDCAFNGKGNGWLKKVKFRIQKSHFAARIEPKNPWMDINELYPNAEVEMKHNIVKVTIDSPQENHEFAVFGVPDVNDRKRMQVGLFGEKPLRGEDWKIWVIIFDDTMMAFQVCYYVSFLEVQVNPYTPSRRQRKTVESPPGLFGELQNFAPSKKNKQKTKSTSALKVFIMKGPRG